MSAADPARSTRSDRRRQQRRRRRIVLLRLLVAAVLIVAAGLTVVLLRGGHGRAAGSTTAASAAASSAASGPALFTDPETVAQILAASRSAVQVVETYDYRTLASAVTAAGTVATGPYLAGYQAAMAGPTAMSLVAARTVQTCAVQRAGIRLLSPAGDQASVVVFASLSVTDASGTHLRPIDLSVTMVPVGGQWLISAMSELGSTPLPVLPPPGTQAVVDATAAGAQGVVNLLTYRRADFDTDFQRALAGLTPALRQTQAANQTLIRQSMTTGGFDLVGTDEAVAVEEAGFDSVTLLVLAQSTRVDSHGTTTSLGNTRYEVAMERTAGHWLLDQLTAVDPN